MSIVSFKSYAHAWSGGTNWPNGTWGDGTFYVGNTGAGCLIAITVSDTSQTITSLEMTLAMSTTKAGNTETCNTKAYLYESSKVSDTNSLKPSDYSQIPSGYSYDTSTSNYFSGNVSFVTFKFDNLSITGSNHLYIKLKSDGTYLKHVYTANSSNAISCTTGSGSSGDDGGTDTSYTLYQPTSCTFSGSCGFYTGGSNCTVKVKTSTYYPYIYAADGPTGTFAYLGKATSGTYSATITQNTSTTSTSITKYFCASDTANISGLKVSSTYYETCEIPRLVCKVYNGSSSPITMYENTHSPIYDLYISSYGLLGFSTSKTTTPTYSVEDSPEGDGWHVEMDGKTLYAIHKRDATITYYKASSTSYTSSGTIYLYGTGQTSGSVTEPSNKKCDADSSYSWSGWSSNGTTTVNYQTLTAAAKAGATTVYGVFSKVTGGESSGTVTYYRGGSTPNYIGYYTNVVTSYYYGRGSTSSSSNESSGVTYAQSPTTTCESDSTYSFQGWATSPDSTTVYSTSYETAFGASDTIYGVYKKTRSMDYYAQEGAELVTVSGTNYIYGNEGKVSYGPPTEPELTNEGHYLSGWSAVSHDSMQYYSWGKLWEMGAGIIYAIWKREGNVVYYCPSVGSSWLECQVYYCPDATSGWLPATALCGTGSGWK